jgi:hypothetical protein
LAGSRTTAVTWKINPARCGGLGDVRDTILESTVASLLGSNITFVYTQPLLAGGIYTGASEYGKVLRNILDSSLFMHDALGIDPVCTLPTAPGCNAVHSPNPEGRHYSIGHWV